MPKGASDAVSLVAPRKDMTTIRSVARADPKKTWAKAQTQAGRDEMLANSPLLEFHLEFAIRGFSLLLHYVLVPIVVVQRTDTMAWSRVFSCLQVLLLWAACFIAVGIEQTFGCDANNLDFVYRHNDMNSMLAMLLREDADMSPKLSDRARFYDRLIASDDE